jgi:hypothetical protein
VTDTPEPARPILPALELADERRLLDDWLDFHRDVLLWKCEGVSPDDLVSRACEPSTLTLIGLVRHMAEVERQWFRHVLGREEGLTAVYDYSTDRDADFNDLDPARVGEDFATFGAEVRRCREVVARYDLDAVGTTRRGTSVSLRWIYLHMIEEYARHNGHADLLRERLDGETGDFPDES